MANRVPLIVDTSSLYIKELPSGDALDLTGCNLVGLTSFTPGTGGGFRFVGVTTFGMGVGIATAFVNDGLIANYLRATNLTDNRVVTAGAGGTLTDSSDLTYDGSTLAVTGAITASTNLTVTGNATVNGNVDLGNATTDSITPTGRFDAHIVPLTDNAVDLGASGVEFKDLYIDGTANIDSLSADTAIVGDLTDNRVVIAGSGGELEDSANLTFDGSTLAVTGNITATGNLNYTSVTDIQVTGIVTASKGIQIEADGLNVEAGISTFAGVVDANDTTQSTSTTTGAAIFSGGVGIAKNLNVGLEVKSVDLNITGISTLNDAKVGGGLTVTGAADLNGALDVDGQTDLDVLNVAEAATFSADVQFTGDANNAFWDKSVNSLQFSDNAKATWGDHAGSGDLQIYHQSSNNHSYIKEAGSGSLIILADDFYLQDTHTQTYIKAEESAGVGLYHTITGGSGTTIRVGTTTEGADITGPGALRIPVGNTGFRPSSPVDGDIRYNDQTESYEGYGNGAWGGLGGGTEIDTSVSSTSATNLTTFLKASYRSASIRIQIVQGTKYQVGRYLLIHDGTTATIVEEAAIATDSMLGTISAAINSNNVEVKVTMGSASSATVTTIIDKISV